ncbi:class I SAM-dependent methyltransferase, partial [Francisella tularensis]|uniref:class I SAM-dependent methyltransferase n=1 Tax=Francisella tularensis TaxID=263 RepID=UPI001CD33DDA
MNYLMSYVIHRIGKKQTSAKAGVRKVDNVLYLAGGTGVLAYKFCKMGDQQDKINMRAIHYSMLEVGQEKLENKRCGGNIENGQDNAEC